MEPLALQIQGSAFRLSVIILTINKPDMMLTKSVNVKEAYLILILNLNLSTAGYPRLRVTSLQAFPQEQDCLITFPSCI